MSKSDPNSAIFMEDSEAEVKTKIKKAYCPPKQVRRTASQHAPRAAAGPSVAACGHGTAPWKRSLQPFPRIAGGGQPVPGLRQGHRAALVREV